jgi:hypothetical protein
VRTRFADELKEIFEPSDSKWEKSL